MEVPVLQEQPELRERQVKPGAIDDMQHHTSKEKGIIGQKVLSRLHVECSVVLKPMSIMANHAMQATREALAPPDKQGLPGRQVLNAQPSLKP